MASEDDKRALRRSLGTTAWAVLADMTLDAEGDGAGGHVVVTSARLVAAHLGIAKDTVARALRRLSEVGILDRRPQSTSPIGRFAAGTYELHLPRCLTLVPSPAGEDTGGSTRPGDVGTASPATPVSLPAATTGPPARRPTRASIAGGSAQLSLLDAALDRTGSAEPEGER